MKPNCIEILKNDLGHRVNFGQIRGCILCFERAAPALELAMSNVNILRISQFS